MVHRQKELNLGKTKASAHQVKINKNQARDKPPRL